MPENISTPERKDPHQYNFSFGTDFAKFSKLVLQDLKSSSNSNKSYNKYTKAQIISYLKAPDKNEKNLREMSIYLYNISNFYRRLILYFSNMLTFAYVVIPANLDTGKKVNLKTLRSQYQKVLHTLDTMNMRHEFRKIMSVIFRDDIFYGYLYENPDSFMIQQLDSNYCKISSIEDGVYNVAWDSSFFQGKENLLENYDQEFKRLYQTYKSKGSSFRWQELDSKKTICIKLNETDLTPIPPFVSLFTALADIEDYRAISKNASETSNYKALSMKLPIDKDTGNFLIDLNLAKDFYRQLAKALPDNIGAILSPMDINEWNFEKSGVMSDTDMVSKSESTFWSEAGTNALLFGGGDNPSSSSLAISIHSDEEICFGVLRQFERWVNRRLRYLSGNYQFKIRFLDVTVYNQREKHDMYLKDGQYGLPVRSAIAATADMTPTELNNMAFLENTVLRLSDNEIPLISSNTQSGKEIGRPTNESEGKLLGDAGEQTQENDSNGER